MDATNVNPYQSPSVDSADAIRGAMEETLQSRSRVEFQTEITRRDLRTAVHGKSFRRDLARLRRAGFWFLIPMALILLLMALRMSRAGGLMNSEILLFAIILALWFYAMGMYLWLLHHHVKANRGLLGPIRGWMDRETLWIEDDDQIRVRPLSKLVGATRNKDQIVLCFDTTHTLFETLPLRAFEDPDTAQLLAEQLERARPFETMAPFDPRRLAVPSDEPMFQAGEDPHFFAGQLLSRDIKGTRLGRAVIWAKVRVVVQLLVTLAVTSWMVWVISFSTQLSIVATSILALVFLRALVRVFRAPMVGQADRGVMFYSAGWFDRGGVVTNTAIGQTSTRWSAFDDFVITDRVISLRAKGGSLWYLTGRGQFSDQESWDAACRFARERMSD